MIIEIPKISPDGSLYEGREPAAALEETSFPPVRPEEDIAYRFFAQVVSGKLIVRGTMSVTLAMECSRCGQFFSTTIKDSSFLRDYELSGIGEQVDLTEDIREDLLLHIPTFSVCKPDCRGLCPHCGINLNQGACRCKPPVVDTRWDDLDRLDV